jgi:hypothetical protein
MSPDLSRVFVDPAEDEVRLPQQSPIQAAEFECLSAAALTVALTSFKGDELEVTTSSTPASDTSESYVSATSSSDLDLKSDTSSPPSSIESPTQQNEKVGIQLPEPFYPPSIIQLEGGVEVKPRSIPVDLSLPPVPQEGAADAIDPQDKYAPRISPCIHCV